MRFYQRISFRVPALILVVLSIGIGATIYYYLASQNDTIIQSKEREIRDEAGIVYVAIKNYMLAGDAPYAVEMFRDFDRSSLGADIRLFRTNGISAFSDNSTITTVNTILGGEMFTPKEVPYPKETMETDDFSKAISTASDVFVRDISGNSKKITIYKPLFNQPKCSQCHGIDHVLRGVITISIPVNDVYRMVQQNVLISSLLYGAVVLLLTTVIIVFLRTVIISRILTIGAVVEGVGSGDFTTKVYVPSKDEIGTLAHQINRMIDGLHERFKLSKFVSRSTLNHVQGDTELSLGGEKKVMTVLFSDVRGFTRYSENTDPDEVMENLNKLMNMQTEIITRNGGDIDKYVGDEIMAVFEGDDMVYNACRAAEEIRDTLRKNNTRAETPFFVGIGINTGEMIAGNMGSVDRIDRTVIGDAVNLGARLCSVAGKNTIIISEASAGHIQDKAILKAHEPIRVKGKQHPVAIFTLTKTLEK